MKDLILKNTPVEKYAIKGKEIYVKREDLCCSEGSPHFSKLRGVDLFLKNKLRNDFISPSCVGVVDTIHSKAGWGVAWICYHMNIPCIVFYPKLKAEKNGYVRPYQRIAYEKYGAYIYPLKATKSAVLYYQARKIFRENYPEGLFLPNGLQLEESIEATAKEVYNIPKECFGEEWVWVVSVSSGTIAKGIMKTLSEECFAGTLVLHLGYSRKVDFQNRYPHYYKFKVIDEKYQYKDKVEYNCPFPCNPYYDLKAWKWLIEKSDYEKNILFWNIGS